MNSQKPAVFLDRDGVIIKETGYITTPDKIELYPGVAGAISRLNRMGWLTIVVTNQSAIARGMIEEKELELIHDHLIDLLHKEGAQLDAIFYCPHLPPDDGQEKLPYLISCDCRKPGIGLFKMAVRRFNIDCGRSFMIGDRETDIVAGCRMGLKTVLLKTGYGDGATNRCNPDYISNDLPASIDLILSMSV